MVKKGVIVGGIIVIIAIAVSIFIFSDQDSSIQISTNNSDVTISTDKNVYDEGETISITVNNELGEGIFYLLGGIHVFWSIEYYEEDEWKKYGYTGRQGFQMTDRDMGDDCYIALFERPLPIELQTGSNLEYQWNQRICPLGPEGFNKPNAVQFIENGQYRFRFSYGLKVDENDMFAYIDSKTVYSNTITIK